MWEFGNQNTSNKKRVKNDQLRRNPYKKHMILMFLNSFF